MVKKRKIFSIIALMLTALLIFTLVGCSKSDGEKEPTPSEEPVNLTMGHPFSGEHPVSKQILIPLAEELSKKTDGRITLTILPGGQVTSPGTIYEDVIQGSIDIGWTLQGYTAGVFPLTEAIEIPFLFENAEEASLTLWRLFEQHEALQKEYGEYKVLGLWTTDPGEFMTKKSIKQPSDLVGLKLRGAGPMQEAMMNKFGIVAVPMPAPEMYDAVERNVIDGIAIGPSTVESYRLHEVITHMTLGVHSFVSPQIVFMNSQKWESLSDSDKELIQSLTHEVMAKAGGKIYVDGQQTGEQMARDGGVEIYELTDADKAAFEAVAATMAQEWIAAVEAKGLPGQEVYDLLIQIRDDLRK